MGTQNKKMWKQKPSKSRLLCSNKGEQDRILNQIKSKIAEIETVEIEECLYITSKSKYNKRSGPNKILQGVYQK